MRRQSRFLACACAAAALLSACHNLPVQAPQTRDWEARRSELQQRDQFDLKARVAVAAGQEGFNARLRWIQSGAHSQVSLDGPLGVGGAQIDFDGQTLRVSTARGEQLTDAAARNELTARLGFEPPLQSLRYWVQGVPDPSAEAQETLDADQRLLGLRQLGWEISYASYLNADGQWLPQRMTLRREALRVRLLVDNWSAHGVSTP